LQADGAWRRSQATHQSNYPLELDLPYGAFPRIRDVDQRSRANRLMGTSAGPRRPEDGFFPAGAGRSLSSATMNMTAMNRPTRGMANASWSEGTGIVCSRLMRMAGGHDGISESRAEEGTDFRQSGMFPRQDPSARGGYRLNVPELAAPEAFPCALFCPILAGTTENQKVCPVRYGRCVGNSEK